MSMITISQKGTFDNTMQWLKRIKDVTDRELRIISAADLGLETLKAATPKDTGGTADGWRYDIRKSGDRVKIIYKNIKMNHGIPIAILLQYGHGTGTGGYVMGRDYINPALKPVFDNVAEKVWEEVTRV